MKVKKPFILRMLPWLIALAALTALIVFVFIPIYTPKDAAIGEEPVVVNYEGDGKAISMENDYLLFEMD